LKHSPITILLIFLIFANLSKIEIEMLMKKTVLLYILLLKYIRRFVLHFRAYLPDSKKCIDLHKKKTENVRKQFKYSKDLYIFIVYKKMLTKTNVWNFHGYTVICFRVCIKNKIGICRKTILRKNSRFSLIFILFFPVLLKAIGNIMLLTAKFPTRFYFLS